jgi:DNA-binding MltR family transcriptional regulator
MNNKNLPKPDAETLRAREAAKALFGWDDSQPIDKEALPIARTLHQESDRGCVLVGFLDQSLEALLRSKMSSDQAVKPTINDILNRENAPLRSFWFKIKLSYAFGFINPNLHDALEMIRKLRNSFAHQHEPVELSTKGVADLIRKLARHEQMAVRAFSTVFSEWATEDIEKLRSALGGL